MLARPAEVAEWHLGSPAADRRGALHPKWRASLRQAEAAGLALRAEPWRGEPGHWLLLREAAQRRARRYRGLPQALACAWGQDRGASLLLSAWAGGEAVAGILLLLHPPVATYQIGWSGEAGRRARAHHLLLWTAAERLAAEGYRRLDLGLIDQRANPGLARFKRRTGATVRSLGGSWVRLPGLAWRSGTG
jgi:hypothetical protein